MNNDIYLLNLERVIKLCMNTSRVGPSVLIHEERVLSYITSAPLIHPI